MREGKWISMSGKVKTTVKIGGREYTMRGVESEEYIHKVAIYVNRKMEEVERLQPGLSTTQIAVLTAINLGDEVLKLHETVVSLMGQPKAGSNSKTPPAPAIYEVARKGNG